MLEMLAGRMRMLVAWLVRGRVVAATTTRTLLRFDLRTGTVREAATKKEVHQHGESRNATD